MKNCFTMISLGIIKSELCKINLAKQNDVVLCDSPAFPVRVY